MKMVNILGVNPSGGVCHDSSACIVVNGKLVAAAEEERFNRMKHTTEFPINAINFCLQYAGLSIKDVHYIAIPWLPSALWHHYSALFRKHHRNILGLYGLFANLSPMFKWKQKLHFGEHFSEIPETIYIEHHLAHAASAFFCSGFSSSSIVTVDGNGEKNSTVAWFGNGKKIQKIREESDTNSLGNFYTLITTYLGLHKRIIEGGEGKTMGLAAYGHPDEQVTTAMRKIMDIDKSKWYKINSRFSMTTASEKGMHLLSNVFNHPKRTNPTSPLEYPYADIAFAAQDSLEKALLKVVKYTIDVTGCDNLCLAGGVTLNCTANGFIREKLSIDPIFIFPIANDGGTSIGAALALASRLGEKVKFKMTHVYWGPEYSNKEIEAILKERKLLYEYYDDISSVCAELISKGNVIGWLQGRMEIGPRALGNRSILADPRNPKMKDIVNESVKKRESWRPFCPTILDEAKEDYLINPCDAPFMILSFKVYPEKIKEIPAVVHVDGTTRPQTLKRTTNERYWKLIKAFEDETGVPLVLNTSFNLAGEPIVCTPRDALKTFFDSGMDFLAMGNYLVRKSA